jgi:hypothetical protein
MTGWTSSPSGTSVRAGWWDDTWQLKTIAMLTPLAPERSHELTQGSLLLRIELRIGFVPKLVNNCAVHIFLIEYCDANLHIEL